MAGSRGDPASGRGSSVPYQHVPGGVHAPASHWSYFPSVPELLITFGIIAAEVAIYIAAVKIFPILGGAPAPAKS